MPTTPRKTILLVEDNPDDLDLTLRAIRRPERADPDLPALEVDVARDGVEALDYFFGPEARPDLPLLVLLDLKLPRIGGLEVLRRLRGSPRTRLLPVVILTSSQEETDLLDGYALGANSYIRKPVDFEQFVLAIHQLRTYWLKLNQPAPAGPAPACAR